MKVYTEDQLYKLIIKYRQNLTEFSLDKPTTQQLIDELTPIELPTDKEIDNASLLISYERVEFIKGALWYREQLKNKQL